MDIRTIGPVPIVAVEAVQHVDPLVLVGSSARRVRHPEICLAVAVHVSRSGRVSGLFLGRHRLLSVHSFTR